MERRKSCCLLAFLFITSIPLHKLTLQALEIPKTKPSPEVAFHFLGVNAIWTSIVLDRSDEANRTAEEKLQGAK